MKDKISALWRAFVQSWKRWKGTKRFGCWLKNDHGQVSWADVKAVPTDGGFVVHSTYARLGAQDAIELPPAFMTPRELEAFYRQFA